MKALALFSGGLDSTLAVKLIVDQGIEVVALHFTGPFTCGEPASGQDRVKQLAHDLGVELITHQLGQEFLNLIASPEHGYGSGLNPCVDCRIYELKLAHNYMKEIDGSFLITGEVVGQRPMSQRAPTIKLIEQKAGVRRLVVRPLSAKHLPPTIPEQNGWIERDQLCDIKGRSRKVQLALADELGVTGFSSPAGGCLLTSTEFSRRLEDLLDHQSRFTERDVELLRSGRMFRLSKDAFLIVGRNKQDNEQLRELACKDTTLKADHIKGPTAVMVGSYDSSGLELAARIVARYSDHEQDRSVTVVAERSGDEVGRVEVQPFTDGQLSDYRV